MLSITTLFIIILSIALMTAVFTTASDNNKNHHFHHDPLRDLRSDPDLKRALSLQFDIESLDIEKQTKRFALEDTYRNFIAKTIFERNQHLRKVPSFWYYTLRSAANSQLFMSPIHHHSHFHQEEDHETSNENNNNDEKKRRNTDDDGKKYCGAGGSDQCVSNDHEFLKLFLRNVRCYRVKPTPESADSNGWTSHQQVLKKQVAVGGLGEKAPQDSLPHHNRGDGSAELRVELEFEPNNIFQERKIFRQVPLQFKTEMLVADETDADMKSDKEHVSSRAYFGLGTTLKWKGKKGRNILLALLDGSNSNDKNISTSLVSFFSLFDEETLAAASTRKELIGFRKVLQHGLSALVNAVCNHLDHNPIPFYDGEHGEESLADLLNQQQHSRVLRHHHRTKKGTHQDGIELELFGEEEKSNHDGENSNNNDPNRKYYGMMTEEEKELIRVLKGDL